MAPLVSVIVTSFNYAEYIGRTIDSVLAQTYPRIELIVVDDGSTDASLEIIASYGDRLRCIAQENGGEAAACNAGFTASHGDIVMFLDSDDLLYPAAVEAIVRNWSAGTAKAQFYLDRIDADGRRLGDRTPNLPFVPEDQILPLLRHYAYYPSPPTSGNAYGRATLERLMPVPEPVWRRGVDGYLNALAALHGRIVSIDAAYGAYRIHDRNMSGWNGLDLRRLRDGMLNEIERENALKHHAKLLGETLPDGLALGIPSHCKSRILSLRLDRRGHPIAGDRRRQLFCAGMRASWRFPHLSRRKRAAAMVGFLLLCTLPRRVLQSRLDPLYRPEKRRLSSWLLAARTAWAVLATSDLIEALASVVS